MRSPSSTLYRPAPSSTLIDQLLLILQVLCNCHSLKQIFSGLEGNEHLTGITEVVVKHYRGVMVSSATVFRCQCRRRFVSTARLFVWSLDAYLIAGWSPPRGKDYV